MLTKYKTKITLGLIGTIAVGILTNAIWDLLKPVTVFLYKFTLNLSILGLDNFKDGIYQDIAKGFHEDTSVEIFQFINLMVFSIALGLFFTVIRKLLKENGNDHAAGYIENFFLWPRQLSSKKLLSLITIYLIIASTALFLDLTKTRYVNSAITYYEQLSRVAAPYMTQDERLQIDSEFAQISSKDDFVQVVTKLETVANENELSLPNFSFVF